MARPALASVGVVWVIYLVYAELYIVDRICLWCTAVHVVTVTLFTVVAYGVAIDTPRETASRRTR